MTRRIYDVSLPVSSDLAGWPGDTPYRFGLSWAIASGATVNVGQVTASIHTGTHVDAPFHFLEDGAMVDALSLAPFLGPARVVDVRGRSVIGSEDLGEFDGAETPRLLLKTGGWPDPSVFPTSIPVMDEELPRFLRDRGVILVGFDVPSVDQIDSKTLPIHRAMGKMGIAILESLDLSKVSPGVYELIALPLRLVGADGSPVRAVLREINPR